MENKGTLSGPPPRRAVLTAACPLSASPSPGQRVPQAWCFPAAEPGQGPPRGRAVPASWN